MTMNTDPTPTATEQENSQIEKPGFPFYKMVALDLDGTLLQSNHKVAPVQAEYLQDLYHQGMTVCIATGRAAPSVYEHVQALNLPTPIPVVCSNGARGLTVNASTMEKKELFYNPVPFLVVERALQLCKQYGFAIQFYHEDSIYVNSSMPEHQRLTSLYSSLTGSTVQLVKDNFASLLAKDHLPSKMLVLFDESKLESAKKVFREAMGEKATIVLGAFDWFLEVLHPEVTKGDGLQKMCQALGIPIGQCIAMGDGANDLEFLEMAGLGLAMKNSKPIVQKHANSTLEWTNDEHGVMKALQDLHQQGRLELAGATSEPVTTR